MASTRHAHLLIVGGGPAGYTAAIYAARANLHPVLIQGLQPGGQLMITTEVENYPGFAEAVMGPWLMDQFTRQAEHCGAEHVADIVTEVDLSVRALPPHLRQRRRLDRRRADRRHRRPGALARARQRAPLLGLRRLGLRHLRRLLLPRQAGGGRGRRQHGRRGGALPLEARLQGHPDPPPRPAPGREDPPGPPVPHPQRRGPVGPRRRGGGRARTSPRASPASGCARCGPARSASSRSTACSSPSATTRRPGCSPASLTWTPRAIS